MTAEPKLPPQPDINTDNRDFWCYMPTEMHAYGLQCFEAGRQQGITEERERREQQDLHDAITAARRNGT